MEKELIKLYKKALFGDNDTMGFIDANDGYDKEPLYGIIQEIEILESIIDKTKGAK